MTQRDKQGTTPDMTQQDAWDCVEQTLIDFELAAREANTPDWWAAAQVECARMAVQAALQRYQAIVDIGRRPGMPALVVQIYNLEPEAAPFVEGLSED